MGTVKIKGLRQRYNTYARSFTIHEITVPNVIRRLRRYTSVNNAALNGIRYQRGGLKEQFNDPCQFVVLPYSTPERLLGVLEVPHIVTEEIHRTGVRYEDIETTTLLKLQRESYGTRQITIMEILCCEEILVDPRPLYGLGFSYGTSYSPTPTEIERRPML